jgi:uncharacterized protein YbjT (DUF2867 family)
MMISNCASSGADSVANPMTGVVTRKDKVTGQEVAAGIRPTSGQDVKAPEVPTAEASLSSSVMAAVLGFGQ